MINEYLELGTDIMREQFIKNNNGATPEEQDKAIQQLNKENTMCSLMDIKHEDFNNIEVTNETPVPSIMKDVKWSWAVDILERHIVHKEYISSTSLLTALERIKCG